MGDREVPWQEVRHRQTGQARANQHDLAVHARSRSRWFFLLGHCLFLNLPYVLLDSLGLLEQRLCVELNSEKKVIDRLKNQRRSLRIGEIRMRLCKQCDDIEIALASFVQ